MAKKDYMLMNPKISIVVPTFNVELYLRKCLDSLINQTLKDIEIICIDDCSADNSYKISEEYAAKDSRIKAVKHDVNRGPGAARNTGLKLCTGDFVWFVDGDDYVDQRACQLLYDEAIRRDVELLSFQGISFFVDQNGVEKIAPTGLIIDWPKNKNFDLTMDCNLRGSPNVTPWAYFSRRSFIEKFSFRENVYHEDVDFTLFLLANCKKFRCISYTPYNYRDNYESITKKTISEKRIIDSMKVCFCLNDYIIEKKFKNHFLVDSFEDYVNTTYKMISEYKLEGNADVDRIKQMHDKILKKKKISVIARIVRKIYFIFFN